jgi:hypothetical protein
MTHTYKNIGYSLIQTAIPKEWKWTVHLTHNLTATGISFSKENAMFNAFYAIDQFTRTPSSKRREGADGGRTKRQKRTPLARGAASLH